MVSRCYNTCFVLSTPQTRLMVDAGGGNGIFNQLERARIDLTGIHHLFVTHCHTDHIMGVIWIIRRVSALIAAGKYHGTLDIYCHHEAAHALRTMCALMMPEKLYAPLLHGGINLNILDDRQTVRLPDIQLTAFDINSTKTLQYGFCATLPDGQRLTCLGDEPCRESGEFFGRDAHWLLSEAYCLQADEPRFNAYQKHHSTVADAARMADRLHARNLILYHTEDETLDTRRERYTAEAAQHFHGNIYVPADLETIPLT